MIKRLRRKFILINLLLVGLVLAVVFILFVGANARRLAGQSGSLEAFPLCRRQPGLRWHLQS